MIKLQETGFNKQSSIMTIANLSPTYVGESDDLLHTIRTMISSGHRRVPVVTKSNDLIGIVTYMDILSALLRRSPLNSKISSIMAREVIFCDVTDSIDYALQKMKLSHRGGLPILKKGKLSGLVSERDFIKHLHNYSYLQVSDIMSHKPFYISPKTSILNAMKAMVNTHYRRLPIVDGREVAGIITGLDVLKHMLNTNFNQIHLNENVEEIMTTPVFHVLEYNDVSDAVKIISDNNIGGLIVVNEENSLKGILTERNIIEFL